MKRHVITAILSAIVIGFSTGAGSETGDRSWDKQLHELNYLIMRTSAINVINGIGLRKDQARSLKKLSERIMAMDPPVPDMTGSAEPELVKVRNTFIELIGFLKAGKPVPDDLRKRAVMARMKEADIITRSIAGARQAGYAGTGCLECHAPPRYFPKGTIDGTTLEKISPAERKRIDRAHVYGMFGDRGVMELWQVKGAMDEILTAGQRYIMKDFQCCLFPPEGLSDPANIGQAEVSREWLDFFDQARKVPSEKWKNVKYLYLVPIEDYITASVPGIEKKKKKAMMKRAEAIIRQARNMDDVDFELQKETLCRRMASALDPDRALRETPGEREQRRFRTAMFLLFPNNSDLYEQLLRKK